MAVFRRRIRFLGFSLAILGVALSSPSQAAEPPARTSDRHTLAELVALALSSTRLLASQDANIEASRLASAQARRWPGLSLEVSGGRRKEAAASGPRFELALAQPLEILGKPGLRGALLDLDAQSWGVRRTAAELSITLNVAELAYEYALNRRKAGFIEARQRRFTLIREYLSGRQFVTPQQKAESRIVQNRLNTLASDVVQSRAGFKASFEKLKVYVPLEEGQHPDIDVPWFSGTKALDEARWLATALENNPDLRAQRLVVKAAETQATLSSREGLPDPSLIASYEEGKASEKETNYGLGLSLALPPWNRNRAGIKSAQAKRLAEERLLGFEEQRLRAELSRLLVEYEAARQVVAQYPQTLLEELEAQLEDAEAGFRKGQMDLLTFLELDSSAAETYGRVLDAQSDLASKLAELFASAGEKDALGQLGSF